MKLSQVPFQSLSIGDRVISVKGTTGKISKLHDYRWSTSQLDDDNSITMDWDDGNRSYSVYHNWCDKIDYLEN